MSSIALTDSAITRTLQEYGFAPDPEICEKIRQYIHLLIHWNKRISLTAITEPMEILRLHIGESVYGVTSGQINSGRLADVGSGAGFPGIPLAFAPEGLHVTLIEPNLKKSVFLQEVKRELALDRVHVVRDRMQNVSGSFEFISSRALGQSEDFLSFAKSHLAPQGKAVLWIGQEDAEHLAANQVGWSWAPPILIPGSMRRSILSGSLKL